MAKAVLFYSAKRTYPDGTIIEIRIWKLPSPTEERPHGYKYSLFFGRPGERLVGYDNERGKGGHKHMKGLQSSYVFVSVDQLISDFRRDVALMRKRI
ncbi:MAG: DUF6516 family protein [Alphaproteobacteria bacterium]